MSELNIVAEKQNDKTVLTSLYFTSPLKVAKPFYIEGKNPRTKILVMQASAGLLEGDRNDISLSIKENACVEYTGQSFTKVFNSPMGIGSSQNVHIQLGENSSLLYMPMPVVPFENSVYKSKTEIHLNKSSRLFYNDIFCCGRKERGEVFSFKEFISRTIVYVQKKIVFLDNNILIPAQINLSSTGLFEGFSHTGIIYLYGYNLPDYSSLLSEKITVASSLCAEGTVIRIFADSAEDIRIFSTNFYDLLNK